MAYMEELAKALKDDDPLTRERVANALKELEDPRATMPLVEALGNQCEACGGVGPELGGGREGAVGSDQGPGG